MKRHTILISQICVILFPVAAAAGSAFSGSCFDPDAALQECMQNSYDASSCVLAVQMKDKNNSGKESVDKFIKYTGAPVAFGAAIAAAFVALPVEIPAAAAAVAGIGPITGVSEISDIIVTRSSIVAAARAGFTQFADLARAIGHSSWADPGAGDVRIFRQFVEAAKAGGATLGTGIGRQAQAAGTAIVAEFGVAAVALNSLPAQESADMPNCSSKLSSNAPGFSVGAPYPLPERLDNGHVGDRSSR
jgi:hypothetical protein